MESMSNKDNIYVHEQPHVDFVFDEKVAAVFTDMINRSVPGYATIVSMIGMLAERYAQPGSRCYDLGCSLGASTLAMRHHIKADDCSILACDNSSAMITRCEEAISKDTSSVPVEVVCADIFDVDIERASIVVLNFTLQFVEPERRAELMQKIYKGLLPGGILILSEKIYFEDASLNELFIEMHHRFKEENGYTRLEISRKRAAIENVLIPETIAAHELRIQTAGFNSFDVWFQCFNFASIVALKSPV